MRQPLRSLRRRRERGRQRVTLVTAGSAAGATALAATFGMVLAAGQAPRANATSGTPAPALVNAAVNAAVTPVDRVAVDQTVRRPLPAAPRPTPTAVVPAPKAQAPAPRPVAKPPAVIQEPERLKPAERAPRTTEKSTAQAPTGAS